MIGDFMHPCKSKNDIRESIRQGKKHILCYGDIKISKMLEYEINEKGVKLYPIERGLKPIIKEGKNDK